MARINIDDDLESKDEFWRLLPLTGGDRDSALGKLVRFFRLAQKAYGKNVPILASELEEKGLACMAQSGWAMPVEGGYRAKSEEEHFGWYRQKLEAGSKGGRPRKADGNSGNRPVISGNRPGLPENPLSPSPAPSPAQKSLSLPERFERRLGAKTEKAREREIKAFGELLGVFENAEEIATIVDLVAKRGTDLAGAKLRSVMGYLVSSYAEEREHYRAELGRQARAQDNAQARAEENSRAAAREREEAEEFAHAERAFAEAFPSPEQQERAIAEFSQNLTILRDRTGPTARNYAIGAWWAARTQTDTEAQAG